MTQIIHFEPMNDQVLIRMDVKKKSILEVTNTGKPTVIPSGVVVAAGKGIFIAGTGFIETRVKEGDHVAVSMDGTWVNLPLSDDPEEVYVTVSESLILGKITKPENVEWKETPWFKMGDDSASSVVAARRR